MNPNEQLNEAAFNDYDPSVGMNDYDPSQSMDGFNGNRRPAGRPAGSRLQQSPVRPNLGGRAPEAQFDLSIFNDNPNVANIELFNAQNSITKISNGSRYGSMFPLEAASSIGFVQNFVAGPPATADNTNMIVYGTQTGAGHATRVCYWNANGDLVFSYEDGNCTVSCSTTPYRSLFEYSFKGAFRINKMRFKFTTSAQINRQMTWTNKTFLGATTTNDISIQSYFRPDQYQGLLVDVPVAVAIDAEKGLYYTLNPNETVSMSIFIGSYVKSAV